MKYKPNITIITFPTFQWPPIPFSWILTDSWMPTLFFCVITIAFVGHLCTRPVPPINASLAVFSRTMTWGGQTRARCWKYIFMCMYLFTNVLYFISITFAILVLLYFYLYLTKGHLIKLMHTDTKVKKIRRNLIRARTTW